VTAPLHVSHIKLPAADSEMNLKHC